MSKKYYIPALNRTKIFIREGSTAAVFLTDEELDEVFFNLKGAFPEELTPINPKARSIARGNNPVHGWKVMAYIKEWE